MPSTKAVSSKVCNQLKIIMLRSYLDRGLPRSLSTSLMVRGKFLPALDLAALNIAAFVLLDVVGLLLGVGLEPGTVSLVGPIILIGYKIQYIYLSLIYFVLKVNYFARFCDKARVRRNLPTFFSLKTFETVEQILHIISHYTSLP